MEKEFFRYVILAGCSLMGLVLTFVGIRGLTLRRPFLIRGPLFTALVSAGPLSMVVPYLVAAILETAHDHSDALGWLFVVAPILLFIGLLMFQLQGFVGFGMTASSFRDGLVASLVALNMKYVESLSTVDLPEHSTRLEIAVQGWTGTAQIRARGPRGKEVLATIVRQMNRFYWGTKSPVSLVTCASYAILGMAILGVVTWNLIAA